MIVTVQDHANTSAASIPLAVDVAVRDGRIKKGDLVLLVGLGAYVVRFLVFAYVPHAWAILPALALHGLCFGCFFFVAFMIVDEETTPDVRASAQGLFNLVIVGLGIIVGNVFAGRVAESATVDDTTDYEALFATPMYVALGCFIALLLVYPKRPAR